MAEEWPAGVPECYLLEGYLEELQPVVIRSPVDMGPAKIRRRFTQPVNGIITGLALTADELQEFRDWFNLILMGGSLSFLATNPITNKVFETRFLQPPRVSLTAGDKYIVELIMEQFTNA